MNRRRIPVLDTFFDRVNNMLWPRFEAVVDMNMNSLRTANAKDLGPMDLSPQYVSKRFAELLVRCLFSTTELMVIALPVLLPEAAKCLLMAWQKAVVIVEGVVVHTVVALSPFQTRAVPPLSSRCPASGPR